MTENDFFELAKKRGLRDENIKSALKSYYFVKEKALPNLQLDESILEIALEVQLKEDNTPNDMVSLD